MLLSQERQRIFQLLLLLAHEIVIFIVCYYKLIFIAYLFPQLLLKQGYLSVLGLHQLSLLQSGGPLVTTHNSTATLTVCFICCSFSRSCC